MQLSKLFCALTIAGLSGSPAVAQELGPVILDFGFVSTASQGDLTLAAREEVELIPDERGFVYLDSLTMNATETVLSFKRNTRNTAIHLIVDGPIVIPAGATVHVDGDGPTGTLGGKGGPGGFDGADAPSVGQGGSRSGFGPGGTQNHPNSNYGGVQYMIPPVGGSGGGGAGSWGGAGGGGAILVASQTSIEASGFFSAAAGPNQQYGGTSGAIRLLAPVVSGAPTFTATHRRIDTLDASGITNTGGATMGNVMIAYPVGEPRIDIVDLDGTPVTDLDDGMSQFIQFALDSATTRTVTIRVTDVEGLTHVALKLIPETGAHTTYLTTDSSGTDLEIHSVTDGVDGENYAERTFTVSIPANRRTWIEAWTRPEL